MSKTSFKVLGEDCEEEENYVQEEGSEGIEGVFSLVGASEGTGGPALAQYHDPFSHQPEPYLLSVIKQMTQIMANIKAASFSEASRLLDFKKT
ncbi:hypothetical protein O181_019562 [Austropuccinia psidii MF-1]|uniref:Uncharacterized protein n=1 Tax=Austropuccinia psidii MF-1 TaxID=1389203 RepID=A0A9Q3GUJ2_9BASI|nr:hypothetical protein [Austropuccinia psidii MF-1]